MAKYPGAFILNEIGTNKELSAAYNVSERTIYRWKSKAKAETGAKQKKPTRPRASTLKSFKGTRKQLAKRYGVSERTAYRWLQKAKESGVDIESRRKKAIYPGHEILVDNRKNKELAEQYNVSESTIKRWKRRARSEIEPFEVLPEPEIETPEYRPEEQTGFIEEDYNDLLEPIEFDEEPFEVTDAPEISDTTKEQLGEIKNLLLDFDLLVENSAFTSLDPEIQVLYISEYINFCWEQNPYQFNQSPPDDPNGPDLSDPEKIANIDIWGDDFENWLANQIEIDNT